MTDITVVMATYKQAKYLTESVRSVLLQSIHPSLRVQSVQSDTKTAKILRNIYVGDVEWIDFADQPSKVANMWKQRMNGLKNMGYPEPKYICFFDSDDVMLPGWLDRGLKVAEEIKSRGKIPIVGPSYRMVDEKLRPLGSTKPITTVPAKNGWPDMDIVPFGIGKSYAIFPKALAHYPSDVILPEFSMDRMMEGCVIPDFSITTTEALRSVGGFFDPDGFDPGHPYFGFAMWLRLLKKYGNQVEVKLLPDIGFLYRQHRKGMHQRFAFTKKKSRQNVLRQQQIARHYFPEVRDAKGSEVTE